MHDKPKPVHDSIESWQEMLAEHRLTIVQVQEIADETGWRGPEESVRLEWERRSGGYVV